MTRSFTRRGVLQGGLGLAALGTLGACASGTTGSENAGNAALRMGWWGSDDRNKRTTSALDLFHESHPAVTISGEFTGDLSDFMDRLSTQIAGGNAPDIWQISNQNVQQLTENGAVVDLTPYVGKQLDLSAWPEAQTKEAQYGDTLAGLSVGQDGFCVFYDVDDFEAIGAEPPAGDWTWQDFGALLADTKGKSKQYRFGSTDAGGDYEALWVWSRQHGTDLFVDGRPGFTRDHIVEWWTFWADLRQRELVLPPDLQAESEGSSNGPLISGYAALQFGTSSLYLNYANLTEHQLALVPMPLPDTAGQPAGQVLRTPQYFGVNKRSKYADQSVEVINFLLNDPAAAKLLGTTRSVPTSPVARKAVQESATEQELVPIEFLETLLGLETKPTAPPPAQFGDFSDALSRIYQQLSFGEKNIDQAADELMQQIEQIFS